MCVRVGSVNLRLLRNGALVRSLLSFGAAFTAEWSFVVAISLVAYADGGALAVGVVGMLRLVPAALLAPVISAYADRGPPERLLVASSLVRGLATLAVAPVLVAGGPTVVVYGLAIVSTAAFTPYRAGHSALMPLLCRTPDELTSVNVMRGGLDSLSVIIGPLVGGAAGGRRRRVRRVRVRRCQRAGLGCAPGPAGLPAGGARDRSPTSPPRRRPGRVRRRPRQRRRRRGGRVRGAPGDDQGSVQRLRRGRSRSTSSSVASRASG